MPNRAIYTQVFYLAVSPYRLLDYGFLKGLNMEFSTSHMQWQFLPLWV